MRQLSGDPNKQLLLEQQFHIDRAVGELQVYANVVGPIPAESRAAHVKLLVLYIDQHNELITEDLVRKVGNLIAGIRDGDNYSRGGDMTDLEGLEEAISAWRNGNPEDMAGNQEC